MYEAPDRYKRMVSARLPGGESLTLTSGVQGDGGSPLRDVQLIARAQLAAFFAAANVVAAFLVAAALSAHVPSYWLLGWAGAVGLANFGAMHLARTQAVTHVGRSGRPVPEWQMVGDVAVRAFLWLSLPLYLFPTLDTGSQIITGSIIAGLGVAALGLVVVPACVNVWMASFTAAVCFALFMARKTVPFLHTLDILFTLGVAIIGVFTVARWAFHQLKTNADMGSASESASLLLQEY
jgi:hypothetical protein